ncbi:MAG: mannose-1-phosphate guanylyltransferase [Opitutales bacterium]
MAERYVVIMAGGRGERFWPQSRLKCPKHLLPIVGDKPMLAQTIERLEGLVPPERVLVITNAEQRAAVLTACPMLPPGNVIGEPVGRDTAPCVGLASVLVKLRAPEAAFALLPADAVIHDAANFRAVLSAAFAAAEAEPILATIGIQPEFPATGYGYLQRGDARTQADGRTVYTVQRFVEKPDLETAQTYLASGEYYWNAGMFIWSVAAIQKALESHTPTLQAALTEIEQALAGGAELEPLLEKAYPELEKISIDYAVMEKADNVVMVESAFDWDDVGAWPAIARHYPADASDNVAKGPAVFHEARGNITVSEPGHLVTIVGASDLIVVNTPDATLVCPKDQAQQIKALVKKLGADAATEHLT